MKKMILIAVLLITSCAAPIDKTKFKNPIFYQKMMANSSATHDTQLTPTSKIDLEFPKENPEGSCELLEDNVTNILMKCAYMYEVFGMDKVYKKITYYHRFTSIEPFRPSKSCVIQEKWYDSLPLTKESPSSWFFYTVEQINGECGPVEPYSD